MKRLIAPVRSVAVGIVGVGVVALGIAALVLLSNQARDGNGGLENRIATPPAVPTQAAPPMSTPSAAGQEQFSEIEKTLIQYYTATSGQQHYDGNLPGDLLLTRFYMYDPETGGKGIIARIEGIIEGFARKVNDSNLYFSIRRLTTDESSPYTLFVANVLPNPNIDYESAPQLQAVIINDDPSLLVQVGLVGKVLELQPAPLTNPFTIARNVNDAKSFLVYQLGKDFVGADPYTGRQLYHATFITRPTGAVSTLTFNTDQGIVTLPLGGVAVVE